MDSSEEKCYYNILFQRLPSNLHTISTSIKTSKELPKILGKPSKGIPPQLVLLQVKERKETFFVHTSFYEMHGKKIHSNNKYLWLYTSLPGLKKEHRILWKCSIASNGKRILSVDYSEIKFGRDPIQKSVTRHSTLVDELKALDKIDIEKLNPIYLKNHLVALYEFARSIHRNGIMICPEHGKIILLSK